MSMSVIRHSPSLIRAEMRSSQGLCFDLLPSRTLSGLGTVSCCWLSKLPVELAPLPFRLNGVDVSDRRMTSKLNRPSNDTELNELKNRRCDQQDQVNSLHQAGHLTVCGARVAFNIVR